MLKRFRINRLGIFAVAVCSVLLATATALFQTQAQTNLATVTNDIVIRGLFGVQSPVTSAVNMIVTDAGVGIGTMTPAANLDVVGTTRTQVLEITGGADLAEPFDVAATDAIQPGVVVSIDPNRPGKLRVASSAYDRKVAGVISGAHGINPGVVMAQTGSEANGAYPVALTGRVYCFVDASQSAVEPGDLLTTSDRLGHAMKVTDYTRAQGAIIGKAMTGMTDGQGLVLVLVSLQ